ncbi:dTDP-4-dehydrorhamnose 3,5-epimerase [Candidimonas nitroreducens]|uniref:dTDP-4-dehydrorhamnose 3,5-epimerase n=1 Tax=Candidimonas nitroreducens TaxID=683354 RepID=A0A225MYV0_9BURK|nr:dTDP-4-dehydrorhamnose 3,5-epimerase [Candidimonas nitroreducens]OWT63869.1 dTDP-4-dehydrorhamnose 3,5-epimerase [Candidimonas nitroreducens]
MKSRQLALPGVFLLEPEVYGDARGFFFESFNHAQFAAIVGRDVGFVQDNHSRSARNVLRGLHYQVGQPQGKLTRVIAGAVFSAVVDLRRSSPAYGKWVGTTLSAENRHQLWIPEGCAHGFLALAEGTEFLYKTTDYYAPRHERCIAWNDPTLAIAWPTQGPPILSPRDAQGQHWEDAETFE